MLRSTFKTLFAALALTLSFSSPPARAQTPPHSSTEPAEIRGQVRYAPSNAPAANVLVRLESMSGGFVGEERTDNLGKFRFTSLLPIQYFVYIRHPGFKEIQREVNLVMVASDYIQLQLVSDGSSAGGESARAPAKLVDANVPAEARKEFEKADAALAGAKLEEGALHLERAVQLYPQFLEAELRLGTVYMDLQQWDKAERALRQALGINQKTANAYFALGEIYTRQRKYDEAEKALRDGLAVEDRSYQGHLALARVYWDEAAALKDEAKLRSALEQSYHEVNQALRLKPGLAEAHLLRGELLLRVPRAPEALAEFQEYLRLEPKGPAAEQTRSLVERIKRALAEQKSAKP